MKHVVLFSGGVSSAYVAYLVLQKEIRKDVVLLHTPVYSENHDADIFRHQIARHLGLPITEWGDGRNIWELIDDNHCLPSQFIPFCTTQLKMKMKEQYFDYLKEIGESWIEYVGYGAEEWRRVQKAFARAENAGRKIAFPVFDQKIASDEIKRIIVEEWGIKLPKAYKDLNHNNCIPCFKAGKSAWKIYWQKYPEQFEMAKAYEKKIGYTVFKDKSLAELEEIWKHNEEFQDSQITMAELPCECWI